MLGDDIIIMGRRAVARSYAKINLTLDVLGKREDGYQEVEMIMQTLGLFDLVITDRTKFGISISTNLRYLPRNEKNIAYKAAKLFFEETGIRGGVKMIIHKNIPVAAGLAGGSGNGAAVLVSLNMLYNAGLSPEELCGLGARLGADVPYCIMGGTRLSRGIGEVLTPLPAPDPMTVLLVKPPVSVSTAEIYKAIDSAEIKRRPDTEAMAAALAKNDVRGICGNLCNVMENVTEKLHPDIGRIKAKMIKDGAVGALMSGSGPTVFGIFDDYGAAYRSAEGFARRYKDTYITSTYN